MAEDYSKKRRRLTQRLKEILWEFGFGYGAYDALKSRRGFTPSDQLLKYSSESFKKSLNVMIATLKKWHSLDPIEECQLKKRILLAVAEVKYGSEEAKRIEQEACEYAGRGYS